MPTRDEEVFERVADRYREAASVAGPDGCREQAAEFCGRGLSLGIAGATLLDAIEPTFRHLFDGTAQQTSSAARISLWDCAATGVARVPQPDSPAWTLSGDGWHVSAHGEGRFICEERPATQLWLDRATGRLVGCFRDSGTLNRTACARPFFSMMGLLCRSLSAIEVHGALVGHDGKAVLVVGGGGRGKSTTAIDGLHGGLDFLGDDSVAIGRDHAGTLMGYSLYASARVKPEQCARWPALQGAWLPPQQDEEKALLLPVLHRSRQMRRSARIVAVAIPQVVRRGVSIARCNAMDIVHAMFHDSRETRRFGTTRQDFELITGLVKELPCYRFAVGADADGVTEGLRDLLGREIQ